MKSNNRGSESSSEYDSNLMSRRSRTQPHPLAYRRHYRYSKSQMNAMRASTLVNLTAFRPVQPSSIETEFEAMVMQNTPKLITDKSSPHNVKGELV